MTQCPHCECICVDCVECGPSDLYLSGAWGDMGAYLAMERAGLEEEE